MATAPDVPPHPFAEALAARLTTNWLGRAARWLETASSTNDEALQWLAAGAPPGAVVGCERQTAGRGRGGRRWVSGHGEDLLLSVVVRPQTESPACPLYTFALAVAVCEAVRRETGCPATIKWPNDIHIKGMKAGGLLAETRRDPEGRTGLVIGLGLNVNGRASDLRAAGAEDPITLREAADGAVDRVELAAAILGEAEPRLDRLGRGEASMVLAEWRDRCSTIGHQVRVEAGDETRIGYAEAVDEEGCLWVRPPQGKPVKIAWNEVRHIRLK